MKFIDLGTMLKKTWFVVIAASVIIAICEQNSFAQFGGRGGLGGIFGGQPRTRRGNTQNSTGNVPRPVPDFYQQTDFRLSVIEANLELTPQQKQPWQTFVDKVRAYAVDVSRERSHASVPASDGPPISGLQHIDLIADGARIHVTELQDIRTAAGALYATLSPDQKKIADERMVTLIVPAGALAGEDGNSNFSGLGSAPRSQH
jgi:LTXXQ motif family protein